MTNTEEPIKFIDRHYQTHYLIPDNIFYAEADNIYSHIVCSDQSIHVSHPLCFVEELLPDYFIRIHRSFLVNRHAIKALYRYIVILDNDFRLPVPARKYQWLKEVLESSKTEPSE